MKIKSRNIICILLIIVLVSSLVSGCLGKIGETIETAADLLGFFPRKSPDSNVTTISGNEDGYPQVIIPEGIHHNDIRFADMVYERPDIENLEARLNTLYEKVLSGDSNNPDQLFQEYQEVMELYDHADSMLSLAYVLYAFNVHEPFYNDEYQYLEEKLLLLDLTLTDLSIALFEMDEKTEQIARETYGESFIQTVYDGEHLNSEEIQEDLGIEEKLIHEYDKLASSYSIQYGDKDITVEELIADESIPIDIKQELYNRYFTEFNAEAGKIFLQLVEVRTRIARKLGYQSYADYQYENYGRDYSTDDARNLQNAVKKYIVPVYLKSILNEYLGEDDYTGFYSLKIEKDSFIDWFKNAAKDFSPLLMESLEYMLRNELYDFKVDENKMEGSFTTYFSDYETPYMFTQWTGDPTCPTTFIQSLSLAYLRASL